MNKGEEKQPTTLQVLIGLFLFDTNKISESELKHYRRFFGNQSKKLTKIDRLTEWFKQTSFIPDSIKELSESIEKSLRRSTIGIVVIAFFFGIGTAGVLFHYDGSQPINVLPILAFFVLFPLGLLLLSICSPFFIKKGLIENDLNKIEKLILNEVIKLTQSFNTSTQAERAVYNNHVVYNKPVKILIKKTLQTASIFYTFGALLWMLFNVTTTDLAFSWSSTLNIGAEHIYAITEIISAPWSWVIPEATVELSTIESTRFFRADPSNIQATSSGQWWSFIFMCIILYSFLPRLIAFLFYRKDYKKSINQAILDSDTGQLVLRQSEPVLIVDTDGSDNVRNPMPPDDDPIEWDSKPCIALLWGLSSVEEKDLSRVLNRKLLYIEKIGGLNPTSDDEEFVSNVDNITNKKNAPDLLVFIKYWESPKIRFDNIIKSLNRISPKSIIRIIPVIEDEIQIQEANKNNWGSRIAELNYKIGNMKIYLETEQIINMNQLYTIDE